VPKFTINDIMTLEKKLKNESFVETRKNAQNLLDQEGMRWAEYLARRALELTTKLDIPLALAMQSIFLVGIQQGADMEAKKHNGEEPQMTVNLQFMQ